MADNAAKVPGKIEKTQPSTLQRRRPFESPRWEVDRLFPTGLDMELFQRGRDGFLLFIVRRFIGFVDAF
jgi:hypothetical protein